MASMDILATLPWCPKDIAGLISGYAVVTKEEEIMAGLIHVKELKRRRKGARVAGPLITWPRRDEGLPYWQRDYTVSFGAQTTRVVTFGQLLPASEARNGMCLPWVYSLPDPEAKMFEYHRLHLPMLIGWIARPHLG
jgi:hypothetical protein